ncbi:hypothetical protein [Bordetella sp. BOR01]|uniref:hypothetical protein n=1 Tax=Bordetella sp. BOR01 TaxID=2854779 RepID=UPI001C484316|nr:hypothetical protein [Bordetella sp. BOR01]MBV7482533.1 hypothetical protein [Bordetella sp. BOR01]
MKRITIYRESYGDMGFGQVPPPLSIEETLGQLCDANGVPIIRFWFDPREKFSRAHQSMRDRASGIRHPAVPSNSATPPPAWSHSTEINGTPTITTTRFWFGPFDFDESEYTFLCTMRPRVPPSGSNMLALSPVGAGTYGPNLGVFSDGRLVVFNGPNVTVRIEEAAGGSLDTNIIAASSFSTENGVTLLKNSSAVASNPNDQNAPTVTSLRFLGGTLSGSGMFEGAVGISMLVAADLTLPKWSRARDLIWQYLSDRSGISLA